MFLAIPVRTQSAIRRVPYVNLGLIAANIFFSLVKDWRMVGEWTLDQLALHSVAPLPVQFFTYQFVHDGWQHLLSNMLFLWVFGNSVNSKMGQVPYLLFYLAGGAFAGFGHALFTPNPLIGASGAVAAVTSAYLVLFPRSYVTVLVWIFIFIQFFELPAMLIIGLKIIVWDNIIARGWDAGDRISYNAHLAGYLFGFLATIVMLLIRALPRDQFDMLAVWRRWRQRGGLSHWFGAPPTAEQYAYGAVGRAPTLDPEERRAEDHYTNQVADLRSRIAESLLAGQVAQAVAAYADLLKLAPNQCMAEDEQLQIGRALYRQGEYAQAADAFERFLECYPNSEDAGDVRLLLGIIYARDLRQLDSADRHLTKSMDTLKDDSRKTQCAEWLRNVRAALGRPSPEGSGGS